MANKDGHRRFGNTRKLPSGRYQIRYPGPDGRLRTGTTTYERKGDAERALSLIEAQMITGEWVDPQRGKISLGDYAAQWIKERANLRPKTLELYTWLLERRIVPFIGGIEVGKVTTQMVRTWRAELLECDVSVSVTAKAWPRHGQGADRKIADALDAQVEAERRDDDDGLASALVPAG